MLRGEAAYHSYLCQSATRKAEQLYLREEFRHKAMVEVTIVLYLEHCCCLANLTLHRQHPLMAEDEECQVLALELVVPRQTLILPDFEPSFSPENV